MRCELAASEEAAETDGEGCEGDSPVVGSGARVAVGVAGENDFFVRSDTGDGIGMLDELEDGSGLSAPRSSKLSGGSLFLALVSAPLSSIGGGWQSDAGRSSIATSSRIPTAWWGSISKYSRLELTR